MMQFTPTGASYALTQTGASVSQTLTAPQAAASALYVYNAGANKAYIAWGVGATTASATSMPVAPGAYFVIGKGYADTVAVFGTNSDVFHIMAGEGQ